MKRDAWLAVIAAALGVNDEACRAKAASDGVVASSTGSLGASVNATPSASSSEVAPTDSIATLSPSASTSATSAPSIAMTTPAASVTSVIGIGRTPGMSCGARAACGAVARPMATPTANIATEASNATPEDLRAIAMLRPRLRQCANHALQSNPNEEGSAIVVVALAQNGDVSSTTLVRAQGVSDASAQCMMRVLRNGPFNAGSAPRQLRITVRQTRSS